MASFICLYVDAEGIVRESDTIEADNLTAAIHVARARLKALAPLASFEFWEDGRRVFREQRATANGSLR